MRNISPMVVILPVFAFIFLTTGSASAEGNPELTPFISANNACTIFDNYENPDKIEFIWSGECENGLAQGEGTALFLDKSTNKYAYFEGEVDHGYYTGMAYWQWDTNTFALTNMKNGVYHGGAAFTSTAKDGTVYYVDVVADDGHLDWEKASYSREGTSRFSEIAEQIKSFRIGLFPDQLSISCNREISRATLAYDAEQILIDHPRIIFPSPVYLIAGQCLEENGFQGAEEWFQLETNRYLNTSLSSGCSTPPQFSSLCQNEASEDYSGVFDSEGVLIYVNPLHNNKVLKGLFFNLGPSENRVPINKLFQIAESGNTDAMIALADISTNSVWRDYWILKSARAGNTFALQKIYLEDTFATRERYELTDAESEDFIFNYLDEAALVRNLSKLNMNEDSFFQNELRCSIYAYLNKSDSFPKWVQSEQISERYSSMPDFQQFLTDHHSTCAVNWALSHITAAAEYSTLDWFLKNVDSYLVHWAAVRCYNGLSSHSQEFCGVPIDYHLALEQLKLAITKEQIAWEAEYQGSGLVFGSIKNSWEVYLAGLLRNSTGDPEWFSMVAETAADEVKDQKYISTKIFMTHALQLDPFFYPSNDVTNLYEFLYRISSYGYSGDPDPSFILQTYWNIYKLPHERSAASCLHQDMEIGSCFEGLVPDGIKEVLQHTSVEQTFERAQSFVSGYAEYFTNQSGICFEPNVGWYPDNNDQYSVGIQRCDKHQPTEEELSAAIAGIIEALKEFTDPRSAIPVFVKYFTPKTEGEEYNIDNLFFTFLRDSIFEIWMNHGLNLENESALGAHYLDICARYGQKSVPVYHIIFHKFTQCVSPSEMFLNHSHEKLVELANSGSIYAMIYLDILPPNNEYIDDNNLGYFLPQDPFYLFPKNGTLEWWEAYSKKMNEAIDGHRL